MAPRNSQLTCFISRVMQTTILLTAIGFTEPVSAELFMGVKIGTMNVDGESRSDPKNYALNLGYELDTLVAPLSVVGEINRSFDKGKTNSGESLEFESNGIYLELKTTRAVFASLRVGIVQTEIIEGSDSNSEEGLTIGAGVGVIVGKTRFKVEYINLAGEAEFINLSMEF